MRRFLSILLLSFIAASLPAAHASQNKDESKDEITEIGVEMTPGYSTSARAFTILLKRDGTASYHGIANMKLLGKFKGTISTEDFDALAQFLKAKNYAKLKSLTLSGNAASVSSTVPLMGATMTTIVVVGGKRRTIERPLSVKVDGPDAPPKELLEIENAITSTAMKIKWAKDK